jgi:cytoskeletal protein CcmA (bactofilin family)
MWNEPEKPGGQAAASGEPKMSGGHISKSMRVEGTIAGSADLYVDGTVKGEIQLESSNLTVGPSGSVDANVVAKEIRVEGTLSGQIQARERIHVTNTGTVEGELATDRIAVEDGAIFRGTVNTSASSDLRRADAGPVVVSSPRPVTPKATNA